MQKKQLSLADLTKKVPEKYDLYRVLMVLADGQEVPTSQDRTIGIVGGAAVEHALRLAITKWLWDDLSNEELGKLFEQDGGAFRTFGRRIQVARALGVISETERMSYDSIRRVRNVFAHAVEPHSFNLPE